KADAAPEEAEREISRRSRRSLLWGIAAGALGFSGWRWLVSRPADDEIPWPLRRVLEFNEGLARDYFRPARLSPTFPRSAAGEPPDVRRNPQDVVRYVSMETPDGGYYVGLDMASALHPQTLLCYEMNGEPLTLEHGAPLRLVIPVKYGIKNIKRIGSIEFTDR